MRRINLLEAYASWYTLYLSYDFIIVTPQFSYLEYFLKHRASIQNMPEHQSPRAGHAWGFPNNPSWAVLLITLLGPRYLGAPVTEIDKCLHCLPISSRIYHTVQCWMDTTSHQFAKESSRLDHSLLQNLYVLLNPLPPSSRYCLVCLENDTIMKKPQNYC